MRLFSCVHYSTDSLLAAGKKSTHILDHRSGLCCGISGKNSFQLAFHSMSSQDVPMSLYPLHFSFQPSPGTPCHRTHCALCSASCIGHDWVALPSDWNRRVSGPEDHSLVGGGEGTPGGQGLVQSLQTKKQRGSISLVSWRLVFTAPL